MSDETPFWHGRRVLVTGCTGFLGGAVARELVACGADVVGLVRDRAGAKVFAREQAAGRFHVVHGQAEDTFRLHSAMAVYEVSAVFHLAASGVGGILQAAKLYSDSVPVVTARPLPQFTLVQPDEPCEDRLSIARFGEVFGPGDRKLSRAVPSTAVGLLTGEGVTPAEGPARDFVFVRDAARACLQVAEDYAASGRGDYRFRSGWWMTDRQMWNAMRAVFARQPAESPELPPPVNPLGWQPQFTFAEAARETLAWYHAFLRPGFTGPRRRVA
jgi:CDP-glucose 4,6-dehydratase